MPKAMVTALAAEAAQPPQHMGYAPSVPPRSPTHDRTRRLAAAAFLGLIAGTLAACEEPKTAADAKDGGTARETPDRSGMADKAHCA